ncbi:MAG TPA: hypothetical protein VMY34_05815 [Acidimicrobiales bacterium]|nr:hypothetical protein [Acidimicrobiales bacterium]
MQLAAVPTRRLAVGALALVAAVVIAMVGSAVVIAAAGEASAADVLARAQRFVARQSTVSFTRRSHVEARQGDVPAGFFADSAGEGAADFDAMQYRLTEKVGPARSEEILVDGDRFVRASETGDLDEEQYLLAPDPKVDAGQIGVFGGSGGTGTPGAGPSPAEPHRLPDLVAAARRPRLLAGAADRGDDGVEVVRARVSLIALDDDDGVRRAVVELAVAPNGRVDRAVLEIEADGLRAKHDYELSDWGSAVEIDAPTGDEIDRTPTVDEAALDKFRDVRILQPRGIPERWVLDGAFVLSEEESGEGCEQVELDYIDPDDEDYGFLTLYESDPACAARQPRGAAEFRAGSSTGWVLEAETDDDSTTGVLVAGDTAIEFDSDLPLAELTVVLADFAPFDPEVPPSPIGGIGRPRLGA